MKTDKPAEKTKEKEARKIFKEYKEKLPICARFFMNLYAKYINKFMFTNNEHKIK